MKYAIASLSLLTLAFAGCNEDGPAGSATAPTGATITESGTETETVGGTQTETNSGSGTMSGGSQSATNTDSDTDTNSTSTSDTMSTDPSMTGNTFTETDGNVPCDIAEAVLEPLPPNIMLVLDKSGSMVTNTWDHDNNNMSPEITRWNSLYDVVDFVVNTFDAQVNFGANLFPSESACQSYNTCACDVNNNPEVPVAMMNANAVLMGIPGAMDTDLYGGTPASDGIIAARDHLLGLNPVNPRAMVFVTDGAANCGMGLQPPPLFEDYDDNLPLIVGSAWSDDDIPTYVVGIDIANAPSGSQQDGSPDNINPTTKLNEVAVAGGKPKGGQEDFYQTNDQMELQDALQLVVDDALSCIVPLDPEPPFPDLLEVYIDDMFVPKVMDCQNEDGWVYLNPNGPYDNIELCGSWCDTLKMVGAIKVEYYCEPG